MGTLSTQPQSFYLPSIQALLAWKPDLQAFDLFNIALVPLRTRQKGASRPLLQDCSDFKGGYVPNADLWPQGSSDSDTYNFSFWQYMDNFCYFSHHRITVPTTWWINAAHQNGIAVIGTVIFEGSSGPEFSQMIGNSSQTVAQLTAIAQHYGFDGWFLNVEIDLPSGVKYTDVTQLLANLRTAMLAVNPNALVFWYDSVTISGTVDYQNCLNANNNAYFVASSAIFPNYWWPQDGSLLQTSISTAKSDQRSPLDVYTGVDVWARGTWYRAGYGSPGMDSVSAAGQCAQAGTSLGLYAPGWTFETATGSGEQQHQNFEKQDTLLWIGNGAGFNPGDSTDCIAQYVPERLLPAALPFFTNFDTGRGSLFNVRGQSGSAQPWSNLSLQGLQPTYRYWAVGGNAGAFKAGINQTVAYDGGASLLVQGTSAGAADTVTYRLFDFSTPISGTFQVNAFFQPLASGAAFPGVQLELVYSDGTSINTNTKPVLQDGWYSLTQSIAGGAGKTLAQLLIVVGPSFDGRPPAGSYGVYIGGLSIWPTASAPVPVSVQRLTPQAVYADSANLGAYLTWQNTSGAARFYDVWRVSDAAFSWLMRVCANAAWIPNVTAIGTSAAATFGVQPVSYGFVAQPQSQMATVQLNVSATVFDDAPTVALLGNPAITQMTVLAGDVLNAIQVTNGAYSLPQHGGTSGKPNAVTLASGDVITQVSGYTGVWFGWSCVVQLSLKTKNGKILGPFGSMSNVTSKTPFSFNAPSGQSIVACNGSLVNVPLAGAPNTDIIASLGVRFAALS